MKHPKTLRDISKYRGQQRYRREITHKELPHRTDVFATEWTEDPEEAIRHCAICIGPHGGGGFDKLATISVGREGVVVHKDVQGVESSVVSDALMRSVIKEQFLVEEAELHAIIFAEAVEHMHALRAVSSN